MLYMITALPGSGKTLFATWWVQKEFVGRAVYYSGIKQLKLPWHKLPSWAERTAEPGGDDPKDKRLPPPARDWVDVPEGSVVVLDECQGTFPLRTAGSKTPEWVELLTNHRHRGLDIVLITQHPKLIDVFVRRLVGSHRHLVRVFGGNAAVIHQWGECNDEPDRSRADSERTTWSYPKENFGTYASAEVHTHKRRIPSRVFVAILAPILGVALLGGGIWYAFDHVASRSETIKHGGGPAASAVGVPGGVQGSPRGVGGGPNGRGAPWVERNRDYHESYRAHVPGLAFTADAYADSVKPVRAPEPQACVSSGSRCRCYTDQATLLPDVPEVLCRSIVAHGYYRAWQDRERAPLVASAASVALPQAVPAPVLEVPPVVEPVKAVQAPVGRRGAALPPSPMRRAQVPSSP